MASFPCSGPHQPATFAERGAYWPGTTPALAGARIRRGVGGLEFLLPNPATGRGVYVLGWSGVRDTLAPTLHDMLLHNALPGAAALTPAVVRAAARQVALDGAAGRAARAAAVRSGTADLAARDATALFIAPYGGPQGSSPPEVLLDALAAVGLGPQAGLGRLPKLLAQLAALRDGAADAEEGSALAAIAALANGVAVGAAALLDAARQQAGHMAGLLAAWGAGANSTALAVNRPAWFLDGWEAPCLLWQDSVAAGHPADIDELCGLLPVLPAEAAAWAGHLGPVPACNGPASRSVDWRSRLTTLDRHARHERLRALAA